MKIIAVLENTVSSGGGFNQALNAILQMQRICQAGGWGFEVFSAQPENIIPLRMLDVKAVPFSLSFLDKLLLRLSGNMWWHSIQSRLKLTGSLETMLEAHDCDLVYFVAPSATPAALQRLNYIATVWDLCHRDTPEFPEVHFFNQFHFRERNFKEHLSPAVAVLTDSEQLADAIVLRYGVDRSRLLPMPFSPAPFLAKENATQKSDVLIKYGLNEGYYFYPAQFWSHKNHVRVLEALMLLRDCGLAFSVVFSGGDQGSMGNVRDYASRNDLDRQVRFLGFVPSEDMRGLYEACQAVVMPTYFGPTNVPPLEAWMLGKPLIYSVLFAEQANNAAILINPDDPAELASAMEACSSDDVCKALVVKGYARLREIECDREQAEKVLKTRISIFQRRLSCWKQ